MAKGLGGLWELMTWPEVERAAKEDLPVVIGVGSTEQHGPHLPVSADVLLPLAVEQRAAEIIPLVIAPPIRYGARSRALSGGGETFPGTLSLRGATLMLTVQEVLAAIARSGFKRLCVHNWHYENAGFLWEACDLAVSQHPDLRIVLIESAMPDFSPEELKEVFPRGFPGWDVEHASIAETSMMMVTHPELIRRERIIDDEAKRHPTWDVVPAPQDFIPKSGVLWHPTEATEEIGHKFIDGAVKRLVTAMRTELAV